MSDGSLPPSRLRADDGLRVAFSGLRARPLRAVFRRQFLGESVLLAGFGGIGGALLGAAVTAVFAASRSWQFALPLWVLAGAALATVFVGAIAGVYPAARAARMSPTAALPRRSRDEPKLTSSRE